MIMNAVGVVSGGRCPPAPPAPGEGLSRSHGNLILFLKDRNENFLGGGLGITRLKKDSNFY